MGMKLLGTAGSPYVRKVRIVLAEKKLEYQMVMEDPWSASTSVSASNPLGKIPCLILEGGEAVFDSRVIVEYLDTLSPVGKLIPAGGRERAEVKNWEALADGILDAGVLARLERTWPGRNEEQRSAAWVERQFGKIHAGLTAVATGLHNKAFCFGNHLTLADIAVVCAIDWLQFRFPETDWLAGHEHLKLWHQKISQRTSLQETFPKG